MRGRLSQQDFAQRLGVTVVSISRYEHGARPELSVLRDLYMYALDFGHKEVEIFKEEIGERTGLDIGERTQFEMWNDFVEAAKKALANGDADNWAKKSIEELRNAISISASLIEQNQQTSKTPPEPAAMYVRDEYEQRLVSSVLRFHRDKRTSVRERLLLETLLAEHPER